MNKNIFLIFLAAVFFEGIATGVILLTMKMDPGRGGMIDYDTLKLLLAGLIGLLLVILAGSISFWLIKKESLQGVLTWMDKRLRINKKIPFIQGTLLILALFFVECFMVSYVAFPVPLRPVFLWLAVIALQAWLAVRLSYRAYYREQPSLKMRIQRKWADLSAEQRKVFNVLIILGVVYFLAFAPLNLLRDRYGYFDIQDDEKIVYPDVVTPLVVKDTFYATVRNIVESWDWQYGYPYMTVSAVVLVGPRLVFGNDFGEQVQINLFLLRQFINVLPIVVTVLLSVQLVTRFRSMFLSAGMFIFLLLVPGIIKYNFRYWHADALIALLVMLTIYFLHKDDLRFGKHYYLAAVTCGLAAAMKLWGFFFFLTVAGTLLAGLVARKITLKKAVLAGTFFILAMGGAFLLSSPSLMAPFIARVAVRNWLPEQDQLLYGAAATVEDIYDKGLMNWLRYFGYHFMKPYFFFFSAIALVAGSLWGTKKSLNRLILGWCLTTIFFLAYVAAMKNFQYMLPVAIPLCSGAFLLPAAIILEPGFKWPVFLASPTAQRIGKLVLIGLFGSQFVINMVILALAVIRRG